jgi:hypothetical protein
MDCRRWPTIACFRASPIAAFESPLAVTLALACIRENFPKLEHAESQITECAAVT